MTLTSHRVVGNKSHEYIIKKGKKDGVYSEAKTPPSKTGGGGRDHEFNSSKCAAYGPVSTPSAPPGGGTGGPEY